MNSNADLLKELRIERKPEPPPSRRGLWIALAVVGAVLLLVPWPHVDLLTAWRCCAGCCRRRHVAVCI